MSPTEPPSNAVRLGAAIAARPELLDALANLGWQLLDKALRLGLGFLILAWTARYLGPEQFGLLNFVMAFTSIFVVVAGVGLDSIVIRELVRSPEQRAELLGTAFLAKLAGGLIILPPCIAGIAFLRPDSEEVRILVAIAALATPLLAFDVIDYLLQARLQMKFVVLARNLSAICVFSIKAWLIVSGAPLVAFVIANSLEILLAATALALAYRRWIIPKWDWKFSLARARSLLRDSWPLMFSALTIVVYMKVDQIMIGQMLGDSQVGTYAAAVRLIEIWYVVPGIIAVSVFPALTRAHASNPDNYFELLQDFFDLMVLIPTLLAILVSIFSSQLLLLTYGTEYIEARSTLLIYAWSSIPVFLLVATAQHLIITNSTRFAFLRNAGGMIINIGLNFALIPLWGIEGSAAASLMAYLSASMLANGLHPEMRKILIMEARALVLPLTLRRLYVTFRSIG
jgi:PST family polysaccharide transporter